MEMAMQAEPQGTGDVASGSIARKAYTVGRGRRRVRPWRTSVR